MTELLFNIHCELKSAVDATYLRTDLMSKSINGQVSAFNIECSTCADAHPTLSTYVIEYLIEYLIVTRGQFLT